LFGNIRDIFFDFLGSIWYKIKVENNEENLSCSVGRMLCEKKRSAC